MPVPVEFGMPQPSKTVVKARAAAATSAAAVRQSPIRVCSAFRIEVMKPLVIRSMSRVSSSGVMMSRLARSSPRIILSLMSAASLSTL